MNRINFQDTHLYPGCLAIFFFHIVPNNTVVAAVAEFSDGGYTNAEVEQISTEEVIVHIDSHTTARGTDIPRKTWRLRYNKKQEVWKVVEKM